MPPSAAGSHTVSAPAHVLVDADGQPISCTLVDASIVFYDGRHARSRSWWKRQLHSIAMCIATGFTHCEIAFRVRVSPPYRDAKATGIAGADQWLGCAVEWRAPLALDFRAYESALWCFYPLELTRAQIEKLFSVCARDVERGVSFNLSGYLWNFISPVSMRIDAEGERVYCSEHVLRSLREIGVSQFDTLDPLATHPHDLYLFLKEAGAFSNRITLRPGISLDKLKLRA